MDDSAANILVVDDSTIIHSLFESVCNRYNLNIHCVTNGQEAIDILTEKDFSLILMDLEMPVMGGLEATRIIRQREKEKRSKRTPIIAISGTTMSNPSFECLNAGMDDFIAKPIALNTILDVILPLAQKDSTGLVFRLSNKAIPARLNHL